MSGLSGFGRRYLLRYLPWYVGGTVALLITNWLSVSIPLTLAQAIDALEAGPLARPFIARYAVQVGLMGLAVIGARTASRVLFFTPGRLVEAQVKEDLFARLLQHQPAFLQRWPEGDLVSRASSDVNFLRLMAGFGILQCVNAVLALGLALVQMGRLSGTLMLWTLVPIVIAAGLVQLVIRRLFGLIYRMQAQLSALSDHILSSYRGVATVQNFNALPAFSERFTEHNRAYLGSALQRAQVRTVIGPVLGLAASINVFILLWRGGGMVIEEQLSLGELIAFTALVGYVVAPLRSTSFLMSVFKQGQAALSRIDEVMEPAPDRPDLPEPIPAPSGAPAITLRDLHFAYPDEPDSPVLSGLDLEVPPGTTLGILGPTGSGKSTLLALLSRLYNPPEGAILVDGVDLRAIDLDGWRRGLAMVSQRPFLFSESLASNITLGRDAPALLDRVLELTAMDVDVAALPEGSASEVGEAGIMLSGGQRQRVALARGLARPHQLLMLDDVLSAVDHATEQALIESLRGAGARPTTVIVANRISAMRHADQIIVLEGGRITDRGRHEELAARPGLYRDTWQRQSEGEES